jgi:DNA-binding NarL/FixJ family response regulator
VKEKDQHAGVAGDKTRIEQAEARAEQAEARTEQAKTRIESAETRTEQAETRTEMAKTRTERAEIRTERAEARTEQVESTLQLLAHIPLKQIAGQKSPLEQLTIRQREILQLIAEGQNTKHIAAILKISPKTVEYHRMKFMGCLNIHDVPGLVRFAMREGLIPPGS